MPLFDPYAVVHYASVGCMKWPVEKLCLVITEDHGLKSGAPNRRRSKVGVERRKCVSLVQHYNIVTKNNDSCMCNEGPFGNEIKTGLPSAT